MTGAWQTVTSEQTGMLRSFLIEREPVCTAISERFRHNEQSQITRRERRERRGVKLNRPGRFHLYQNALGRTAAVYQGPGGYFFPLGITDLQPRLPGLGNLIDWHIPMRTVIGATDDVVRFEEFLQEHLPFDVTRVVDYSLLAREGIPEQYSQHPPKPDPELEVRRPDPGAWRSLMPIQLAYEQEEVLAPGRKPIAAHSRDHLIDSLHNQIVLIAIWRETIVGRVATNALGYHYGQVGGVYTLPSWRRRGIARWLMLHLLYELQRRQRGASLFVKRTNTGAQRLYTSLGFHEAGPFRISYFTEPG